MSHTEGMNIYQRINEVRKAVQYVKKDAVVQGYRAVTHDMVTAKLRDELVQQGILVTPNQLSDNSVDFGQTKSGTTIIRYEAAYEVHFINIDDPGDRHIMVVHAHANDQGDKAPGKAISYATKYAMLKMFSLETGENEESRVEGERKGRLVIEHLTDEMHEYIDSGDALGLHLFSKKIGQEAWSDLYNSGVKGKKTELKTTLNDLDKLGHTILVEIKAGLLEGDSNRVLENVQDLTASCKKLLAVRLGADDTKTLKGMVEEAEQ